MEGSKVRNMKEVEAKLHVWGGQYDDETTIEGIYMGRREGKYGPDTLFRINRGGAKGIETWTCPAILANKLGDVPLGAWTRISHLGSIESKNTPGQLMHNFKVEYEVSQTELPTQ